MDEYDKKLQLLKVGDIPPENWLPGDGRLGCRGSSPRDYFNVPNTNVLFEAEVFVETEVKECYLVGRSNHEDRPNGFGGYYLYLNFKDKLMYFKKELTHEKGYSSRLKEVDIGFSQGTWHKAMIKITNQNNGNVRIEGKFNDSPTINLIDDGSIACGTEKNTLPFRERGKWCFLRTNAPKDMGTLTKRPGVYYRNVKITNLG